MAKIFGSAKVQFHGREKELKVLREIYDEVCGRDHPKQAAKQSQREETPQDANANGGNDNVPDGEPNDKEASREKLRRSVAFVSGISGTGKSALIREFVQNLSTTTGVPEPLFLTGKFDELAGADPFSAIVEAFGGLATMLLDDEEMLENTTDYTEDLIRIQRDVKRYLGKEDIAVLTKVVPALTKLFSGSRHSSISTANTNPTRSITMEKSNLVVEFRNKNNNEASTQNASNRLRYVLQLFTRTIATSKRPIVMFLDDLQWADNGSLDILQALVTDKRIKHFMFLGTYRSDEVDFKHPLSQRLSVIQKTQPVESISVGTLSKEELIAFLHAHMKIDSYDCENLAEKLHATTNGNIFFVIQVLVELNQQCALIYSEFSKRWEWDHIAGMLTLETGLSDNLEEAVEAKIKRSGKLIKRALVTMAYARSTIDLNTLYKLMEKDRTLGRASRHPLDAHKLSKALDRAVLEGFLSNNIGSKFYSFAHDKVLQASYSLVPEGKAREKFRLLMGKRLYQMGRSPNGEAWMLFAAAEHLNSSLVLTDTDPLFVARMNLEIGEQAARISAYDQASQCLVAGLEALLMMPDFEPWEAEYDLTLRLHRAVADVELCRGRFESGNEIGRRLLEKATSLDDKLPTYESLSLALGRAELHAEALDMNRDALIRLSEYPKHNRILVLLKELLVVRRFMKQTSDSDFLKIPKMTDESKENALVFSRGLAVQAFYCDNLTEFLLASVRCLQITFQYGLSGYSAMAIVAYGLILCSLNDHEGALRGCRLARSILKICDAKSQVSMFNFCAPFFIEGWGDPHEKSLETYRQGHLIGMEVGDVENAFHNSFGAVHHARACGSPLGSIAGITSELLEQLNLYNVKSIRVMMEQAHLPVQYFTGAIGEPNWDELGAEPTCYRRTSSENLRLLYWYIARVEIGVYYGNFAFADRMADKLRKILPRHFAYVPLSFRLFYSGLAASGMARQMQLAGKRWQALKYRAKAKGFCNRLGHLNRSIGSNSYHRELIMLADLKLSGKEQKPISYERAINASLEVGHIHDAALCSELAGEYYLSSDKSKAGSVASNARNKLIKRHFTRARDLYNSWGAYSKVELLEKNRGDYIEGKSPVCKSGDKLVVSMDEVEMDSSSHSGEDDGFAGAYGSDPVLHNPKLLCLLAGIVPSSEDTSTLSSMPPEKQLGETIKNDESSIVSDL